MGKGSMLNTRFFRLAKTAGQRIRRESLRFVTRLVTCFAACFAGGGGRFRTLSSVPLFFLLTEKIQAAGEAVAEGGKTAPKPTALEQFFPFILLGLFFYFILIRPQQKKAKSHNQFLSRLKRGDEVLTTGGIFGSIEGLTDQFVILEVAENVRIRIMKSQIASHTKSLTDGEKRR